MSIRGAVHLFCLLPLILAAIELVACADYIALKNGGQVRGELPANAETAAGNRHVVIRTMSGAMVTVEHDQVEAVVRRRLVIEDYETRRRAVPDTVAGHWRLAEWCRQKSLAKPREFHLLRVVELDPEHTPAQRGLGRVRRDGRWATPAELLTAQGYVKHKGKLVLPQEVEVARKADSATTAERSWLKRIKQWQRWLAGDRGANVALAAARLREIRDPDALPALARVFRDDPQPENRLLYVEILSQIDSDRPLMYLVVQSLVDEAFAVRDAAIRSVRRKGPARAVPIYVRELRNRQNPIVNRAAVALGQLADDSVIPHLIAALVTRHQTRMVVPDENLLPDPAEADHAADTSSARGDRPSPDGRMPAVVGNLESAVLDDESEAVEIEVEKDEENPSVLEALTLLTNRNFGYDLQAWRTWYNGRQAAAGSKKP